MTIIFRCNTNPEVGFGHLNRCRTLAQSLVKLGQNCLMIGPDNIYKTNGDSNTFKEWIPIKNWKSSKEDSVNLIKIAKNNNVSYLVLDDYRIDEKYQMFLLKAGYKWLQFYQKENKKPIWADIIVNPMPGVTSEDFKSVLRNKNSKLLLGPNYAILRSEFENVIKKTYFRKIKKVLLTFGGGDDKSANEFVLSTLLPVTPNYIKFLVISGFTNPNNNRLKEWILLNGSERVDLLINPKDVAKLYSSCDIAVIAGGTTTYEIDCCGLPFLIISTANNQIEQSKAWANTGKAKYLGDINSINKHSLVTIFKSFLKVKQVSLEDNSSTPYDGSHEVAKHIIANKY